MERLLLYVAHLERRVAAEGEEARRVVVCREASVEFRLHLYGVAVLLYDEDGIETVERLGDEVLYLALALNDEPHRHRLHASGRECGLHLAPQHGRELEADEAVEHAARLLRIDKIHVEMSRMLYGVKDGGLRDFVEDDAGGLCLVKPQHLAQMPRDGFSLAVFIGCQPHLVGFLHLAAQLADELLFLFRYLILRLQCGEIDADLLLLQIADVAVRRHHLEILS